MIYQLSRKLSVILCDISGKKQEIEFVRYGLEIIIGALFKLIALLLTAYLFGVVHTMLWAFITFASFRALTGGHHYSTYSRCLISGIITLIGISYAASKLANIITYPIVLVVLFFSLLFGIFLVYRYAPSNHFYKKINEYQKYLLRKLSFFALFLWAVLIFYLLTTDEFSEYALASILGFIVQLSSIHPLSYSFVEKFENLLNRR